MTDQQLENLYKVESAHDHLSALRAIYNQGLSDGVANMLTPTPPLTP